MGRRKGDSPLSEATTCTNGHVIAETGLYTTNGRVRCRACHIESVRAVQIGRRMNHPRIRLPFDAIAPYITKERLKQMDRDLQRNYYRARLQGYTSIEVGDRLATSIGRHPALIWGWSFYANRQEEVEG